MANVQWERTFGVARRRSIGKTDLDLLPRPIAEVFLAQDRRIHDSGEATEWEDTIPVGDGTRTYLTIKFPLLDTSGRTYAIGGLPPHTHRPQRADEGERRGPGFPRDPRPAAPAHP